MRLVIRLLGLLCGALLSALLYWWMWTETGMYAWLSNVLGVLGNLGLRWTFVGVLAVWLLLAILLVTMGGRLLVRLAPGDEKAVAVAKSGVAHGIFFVPLLVLGLSIAGVLASMVAGAPKEVAPTAVAREAGWWPRNVRAGSSLWTMDGNLKGAHYPSVTSRTVEIFLPVGLKPADNAQGRSIFVRTDSVAYVALGTDPEFLKKPIEGVLAIQPLTARCRRELEKLGQPAPIFAVVLEHQRGALGYWMGTMLLHLVPFGVIGIHRVLSVKKKAEEGNAANIAK